MKREFHILALAAMIAGAVISGPVLAGERRIVVELFTSQGCSSCPPADALLGELATRRDVIALSFHVDYWNYIGWSDPFARPGNTRRQHAYERKLKRRYVYTPQMVVDGRSETVGSNRSAVQQLIREAGGGSRLDIRLSHDAPQTTRIRIPAARHRGPPATIWAAFYDNAHTTTIRSGENRGRTLTNSNVVRSFQQVGTWRGGAVDIVLNHAKLGATGRDGCAVLVQKDGTGPILGAATIPLPKQ